MARETLEMVIALSAVAFAFSSRGLLSHSIQRTRDHLRGLGITPTLTSQITMPGKDIPPNSRAPSEPPCITGGLIVFKDRNGLRPRKMKDERLMWSVNQGTGRLELFEGNKWVPIGTLRKLNRVALAIYGAVQAVPPIVINAIRSTEKDVRKA